MLRAVISCLSFFALFLLSAQLDIASAGTTYTIDFDTTVPGVNNGAFNGSGFQPAPSAGRLDSDAWEVDGVSDGDLAYGGTEIGGDHGRGTSNGGVTSGGVYAFQSGGISGRALGVQPAGSDFTDGYITLRAVNNTGLWIHTVDLDFELWVKNDQARGNSVETKFLSDVMVSNTNLTNNQPLDITPLDFVSVEAPGPTTWQMTSQSESITGVLVAPGDYLYIRWVYDDAGTASGSRDEFAIDDIAISVSGTAEPSLYTQNSGEQRNTNGNFTTQLWSSLPGGNYSYKVYPFLPNADMYIQTGHQLYNRATGVDLTLDNLTVEAGGSIRGDAVASSSLQRYWQLYGDLTCDGQIGNATGVDSNFSLRLEAGVHTISGTGDIYLGRLRKSELTTSPAGNCDLTVAADISLLYNQTALFNGDPNGAPNLFNITVNPGVTLSIPNGDLSLDSANPTSGFNEGGSVLTIEGTIYVGRRTYISTNNTNTTRTCTIEILNGGRLETGELRGAASGIAGFEFLMRTGSWLEIHSELTLANTWFTYNPVNLTLLFEPGSTVEYSKMNSQNLFCDIEYQNLVISGSNAKSCQGASPELIIRGDLEIQSGVLNSAGKNILINGSWSNYNQIGFTEGIREVVFENLTPGVTRISCGGGEEIFNDLEIRDGEVFLDDDIDILDDLELNATLNLNSNNIEIRNPAAMSIPMADPDAMIISEDALHQGTIQIRVGSFTGPVDFPFGTLSGDRIYARFQANAGSAAVGDVIMATYPTAVDNTPWPIAPVAVNNLISSTGLSPDNRTATVDRFWSVEVTGSGVIDAQLELSFLDSEMPTATLYNTVTDARAQRYNSTLDIWEDALPGQTTIPNAGGVGIHRTIIPNVTQFSPWAIASLQSPLPVELLSFDANTKDAGVMLEWNTASEWNNSHFEIYRDDELIGRVLGNGNTSSLSEYQLIDTSPRTGWNYYDLYQEDFDGTKSYEGRAAALWSEVGETFLQEAFFRGDVLNLHLYDFTGPVQCSLLDASGRMIQQHVLNAESQFSLQVDHNPGLYILQLQNGETQEFHKLVKPR